MTGWEDQRRATNVEGVSGWRYTTPRTTSGLSGEETVPFHKGCAHWFLRFFVPLFGATEKPVPRPRRGNRQVGRVCYALHRFCRLC